MNGKETETTADPAYAVSHSQPRSRIALVLGMAVLVMMLTLLQITRGAEGREFALGTAMRGLGALLGINDPLPGVQQSILELRTWRALCAGGVGAALALSGALLQGLFRNGLASPSLLGVGSGAGLMATVAILLLGGGLGAGIGGGSGEGLLTVGASVAPWFVCGASFIGALAVVLFLLLWARRFGRVSLPTLLLLGLALNVCLGGAMAALQSVALEDVLATRSILAWTFGVLDDRQAGHVAVVFIGLAAALAVVPFVAVELDLFASGEEDAAALGVATGRVKVLALLAAALATACAVSTVGQIGFVGLVVPHVVRLLSGRSHRHLLPLSALAGAVLLLGTDFAQLAMFDSRPLAPGVLMSLLGGPFFLWLLFRQRRRSMEW